ncbi:hypothetical protein [Vibrio crassostreae]|uniref:hypothetical protein n=1 Tax=Vibrio crassostreae TaxID=246167 RepID=UPI001B300806|nr:hypothetical protein [Vibrio crassostreae]
MTEVFFTRKQVEQKAIESGYDKGFAAFIGKQLFDIDGVTSISLTQIKQTLEAAYNRPHSDYEQECGAEWHNISIADFKTRFSLFTGFLSGYLLTSTS